MATYYDDWQVPSGPPAPYGSPERAAQLRALAPSGQSLANLTPEERLAATRAAQNQGSWWGDTVMDAGLGVLGGVAGGSLLGLAGVGPWAGGSAATGGNMDFGFGEWDINPTTGIGGGGGGRMPGVGDAGAFDQWGSLDTPGGDSTIFGGTAGNPFGDPGLLDYIRKIPGINRLLSARGGSGPNGQVTDQDLMRLLGSLGGAGLGYLGSSEQRRMFQGLADRYWGAGEPYRQRLEQTYKDPTGWMQSPEVQAPVQQGTDIMARSLSTQGNPAGSGNALQQLQNYSSNQLFGRLGEERTRLGNLGGLPMTGSQAASTNAITAAGKEYSSIGAGINDIFSPPRTLAQSLDEYKRLQNAVGGANA